MSLDTITKEQFQLYQQVQEKEKELQTIKKERGIGYGMPISTGILAVGMSILATTTTWPIIGLAGNAFWGFAALACACGTYKIIKYDIPKNKKVIGNLEQELEELKSKPEYKALE